VKAEVTRAIQLARKRIRGFMQHSDGWREQVGEWGRHSAVFVFVVSRRPVEVKGNVVPEGC
jgi:hypothetical protein